MMPHSRLTNTIQKIFHLISLLNEIKVNFREEENSKLSFFFKVLFVSNVYTQCGTHIYNPEIRSCVLYHLSPPGAPTIFFFYRLNFFSSPDAHCCNENLLDLYLPTSKKWLEFSVDEAQLTSKCWPCFLGEEGNTSHQRKAIRLNSFLELLDKLRSFPPLVNGVPSVFPISREQRGFNWWDIIS